MTPVICDMSASLDGYVTGPNDSRENPFGDGAGMLHDWMFDAATDEDRAILQEMLDGVGAVVMGRKSFDKERGRRWLGRRRPCRRYPVLRGHSQQADDVAPARLHVRHRRRGQRD
jgi:dihydrofolate reductase